VNQNLKRAFAFSAVRQWFEEAPAHHRPQRYREVDLTKWTFPPFSATRNTGYVYGRGTIPGRLPLSSPETGAKHVKKLIARIRRTRRPQGWPSSARDSRT
jgi:hypothetical protein